MGLAGGLATNGQGFQGVAAAGGLVATNNLSDVSSAATSLTNLGGASETDVANGNGLATGISTYPRFGLVSNVATVSQRMIVTYFTATKSFTSTTVKVMSGGTLATATPSLVRFALYAVDSSDNLTSSLANITSDTSIFAAANTAYSRSWASSVPIVAGTRYAFAVLIVSAQAMPTLVGLTAAEAALWAEHPALGMSLTSQADLPSSATFASLANTNSGSVYAELA